MTLNVLFAGNKLDTHPIPLLPSIVSLVHHMIVFHAIQFKVHQCQITLSLKIVKLYFFATAQIALVVQPVLFKWVRPSGQQ